MTDESDDIWSVESILKMLRRQIKELESALDELRKLPNSLPADDSPELMDLLLELRLFRKTADDIKRELKNEQNN